MELGPLGEFVDIVLEEAHKLRSLFHGRIELDEAVSIAVEATLYAQPKLRAIECARHRRSYLRVRVRGHLRDCVGAFSKLPRRAHRRYRAAGHRPRFQALIPDRLARGVGAALANDASTKALMAADRDRLHRAFRDLPPRQNRLLSMLFFEGRTLTESAELIGVSTSWGSRLRNKAITSLVSTLD